MKQFCLLFVMMVAQNLYAIDWTTITTSGDYYYGEGKGATFQEASNAALKELLEMIAVNVTSGFDAISEEKIGSDGNVESTEKIKMCMQTYSSSSLNNVEYSVVSERPQYVVRKWMKRSELESIYKERIERIKFMKEQADKALDRGSVDIALQYYYWAYTLVRSLQYPTKARDAQGYLLIDKLPMIIKEVLRKIKVEFVGREGDEVFLFFTYNGQPADVDFKFNDGRQDDVSGEARGGQACMYMAPGYGEQDAYHIDIDYEQKNWAGDDEMRSVLNVLPRSRFEKEIVVRPTDQKQQKPAPESTVLDHSQGKDAYADNHQRTDDKEVTDMPVNEDLYEAMQCVLDALQTRQYDKAMPYFTGRGQDNYLRLIRQRNGRLIGNPQPRFYRAATGKTLARGVQMAFSVTERGHKTTLVDDVIFTFDGNGKISNLTFGIGAVAERDLLNKPVEWGEDVRQQVMDFLENYKTAYCLKDSDYIRAIFDDNATIIVGYVAKRTTQPDVSENRMPQIGRDIITTNRYTKDEYLRNLRRTFDRNQFINIKFTSNDVQYLQAEGRSIFGIKISQEYTSSTYADQGYLFLMVDMTQAEQPLIKYRTWQPKPDPEFGLYGPGFFTK